MSVVVFGSVVWDVAGFAPRIPKPGETLLGDSYKVGLGGKGANQAVAARKLGADVAFFGKVGRDAFAGSIRAAFAENGLDPAGLDETDVETALALIQIGRNGENAILLAAGANRDMQPEDVERARSSIQAAKAVLLQLEIPLEATLAAARAAREAGATSILDPAPAPQDGVPGSVFMAVDVVTPNELEAETYCGFRPTDADSGHAAAERLIDLGAPAAVITLGAAGVAWAREDGMKGFQPPFQVDAIDTVAAGDCFNGALAVALTEGQDFAAAVRFAAAAGALATTKPGASAAAPTREDIETLLNAGSDR